MPSICAIKAFAMIPTYLNTSLLWCPLHLPCMFRLASTHVRLGSDRHDQRAPSVDALIPPTAVTASRLTLPPCPMQGFCAYTHSSALPSARSNGKQHLALTLEAPPPTVDQ